MKRLAIVCQEEPAFLASFLIRVMAARPQQVAAVFIAGARSGGERTATWRQKAEALAVWRLLLEGAFLRCLLYRLLHRRSVAAAARRLGIPVQTGVDPRDPAFAARLAASGADLALNQSEILLPPALLAILPGGFINRHASLLPAHRGRMAGFFAHAAPVPSHGFTIHRVTARLDDGPVLHQEVVAGLDPRWGYPRIMLALLRRAAAVFWTALDRPGAPMSPGDGAPAHRFPTLREARAYAWRMRARRSGIALRASGP